MVRACSSPSEAVLSRVLSVGSQVMCRTEDVPPVSKRLLAPAEQEVEPSCAVARGPGFNPAPHVSSGFGPGRVVETYFEPGVVEIRMGIRQPLEAHFDLGPQLLKIPTGAFAVKEQPGLWNQFVAIA